MNMLATATDNIPLHCNICPTKPNFSDVSHLLTHVASKGHLSNYYKMKVRGSTEPSAKKLVDDYDEWYEDHNVQALMRERMTQKERRRGSRSASNASRRAYAATSVVSSRSTSAVATNGRRATRQLRDNVLDPQLGNRIKSESKSRSATPGAGLQLDPAAFSRAYAPPMQSWPTTPYKVDSPMKRESLGSSWSDDASFEFDPETATFSRGGWHNPSSSNQSLLIDDEWEMDETINDASKLKGVYWPGMALFDSATPEMKRKRNQKKAFSVTQHLQATSEVVEPNEMVFDARGILRKQREITGNPDDGDDDSPLSGEMTPEPVMPLKKRASRRPRAPLAEKSVNTGRVLRRRRESHHPPFGNRRATPYFDGVGDEDDDLTYGQPKPRKRTGLSIHRDNSGPDITFEQPPAPAMNILNSGFRNPLLLQQNLNQSAHSPYQQQQQQPRYNGGHHHQPSFTYGSSFRPNSHCNTGPGPNLASFGQLSHNSLLFQGNSIGHTNGHSVLDSFQQHFGYGAQHTGNSGHGVFQNQNQAPQDWEVMFGLDHAEQVGHSDANSAFHAGTDLSSVNPLFFSSNLPTPEDDQATISPPQSEH